MAREHLLSSVESILVVEAGAMDLPVYPALSGTAHGRGFRTYGHWTDFDNFYCIVIFLSGTFWRFSIDVMTVIDSTSTSSSTIVA